MAAKLATGFVASVRGVRTADGKIDVHGVCLTQGLASAPLPAPLPLGTEPGPYLALLSGLLIGAPDEDIEARNRACEFLKEQSSIERIIVCGGVYWVGKLKD